MSQRGTLAKLIPLAAGGVACGYCRGMQSDPGSLDPIARCPNCEGEGEMLAAWITEHVRLLWRAHRDRLREQADALDERRRSPGGAAVRGEERIARSLVVALDSRLSALEAIFDDAEPVPPEDEVARKRLARYRASRAAAGAAVQGETEPAQQGPGIAIVRDRECGPELACPSGELAAVAFNRFLEDCAGTFPGGGISQQDVGGVLVAADLVVEQWFRGGDRAVLDQRMRYLATVLGGARGVTAGGVHG